MDLRSNLLGCLEDGELRREIVEAVLREATGAAKTTNVLKAFDLLDKLEAERAGNIPDRISEQTDFSTFSDAQLRALLTRLEREPDG